MTRAMSILGYHNPSNGGYKASSTPIGYDTALMARVYPLKTNTGAPLVHSPP